MTDTDYRRCLKCGCGGRAGSSPKFMASSEVTKVYYYCTNQGCRNSWQVVFRPKLYLGRSDEPLHTVNHGDE